MNWVWRGITFPSNCQMTMIYSWCFAPNFSFHFHKSRWVGVNSGADYTFQKLSPCYAVLHSLLQASSNSLRAGDELSVSSAQGEEDKTQGTWIFKLLPTKNMRFCINLRTKHNSIPFYSKLFLGLFFIQIRQMTFLFSTISALVHLRNHTSTIKIADVKNLDTPTKKYFEIWDLAI